jgi:hypothetical protein
MSKHLRLVLRKFPGAKVYKPGMVVDTEGWTTVTSLERTRYLRPLHFGEEPYEDANGSLWISEEACIARAGSPAEPVTDDRASSASDEATDADPPEQVSSDEEEEGDGLQDEEEGAEDEDQEEVASRIESFHLGGGWYNVFLDGKKHNKKTLRKTDLDGYVEQLTKELQKE